MKKKDLQDSLQFLLRNAFVMPRMGQLLAESIEKDSAVAAELIDPLYGKEGHDAGDENLIKEFALLLRTAVAGAAKIGQARYEKGAALHKKEFKILQPLIDQLVVTAEMTGATIRAQWKPSGNDCFKAMQQFYQAQKAFREALAAYIQCLAMNPPETEGGPFGGGPAPCQAERTAFNGAAYSLEVAADQVQSQCGGWLG